jgi:hypothetical protein
VKRLNAFSLLLGLAVAVPIAGCSQKAQEPVEGGSCRDMENYFNQNFGRNDTKFSNYEGQVELFVMYLRCGGGVVIQTLPTGKKTCPSIIAYNLNNKRLTWESTEDCFVSQ